jgi:hypothetical protein
VGVEGKKPIHFTITLNSDILPYNFYFLAIWKVPLVVYYNLLRLVLLFLFCCHRNIYGTLSHTTKTTGQAIQKYIYISHYTVLNWNILLPGSILLHATRSMKRVIQCYRNKCHYTVWNYIIYWQFQVESNSATLSWGSDFLVLVIKSDGLFRRYYKTVYSSLKSQLKVTVASLQYVTFSTHFLMISEENLLVFTKPSCIKTSVYLLDVFIRLDHVRWILR